MAQKETSSKSRRWLGLSGAAVLVANLVLTGTTIAFQQEGEVNHALGIEGAGASYGGTEFSADGTLSDASYEKYIEAAYQFCEQEEEEGSVLLYNRNNALPLSESERNVTVFGRGSIDPVFRSTAGGSSTNPDYQKTPVDALQDAGFNVNQTVLDAYASAEAPKERSVSSVGEYDPALFTGSVTDSFASYGDVAFVTLSRFATEGNDLAMVNDKGKRMLELDDNEKAIFQQIKDSGKFKKTVVLLNSVFAMEMDWLDEYNVDAVLWVGNPGFYGMPGAIRVVTGEVNPSGHTTATFAANSLSAPSAENFGLHAYNYGSKTPRAAGDSFVSYNEGIYVGYRYYETAAAEGFIDYGEAVVYPFGYGLSYTDFSWEVAGSRLGGVDGSLEVDVTVTNTGAAAGKDVVQLYYTAPYTKGGIEKAEVVLGDFAKTSLLAPGASETVTLAIPVEDMASYDYLTNRAYVLEAGDYILSLRSDSHTVKAGCENITYNVGRTVVYGGGDHRASDKGPVTNQFDDVTAGVAVNLSRADFAGTFPTAPAGEDFEAGEAVAAGFQVYRAADHEDPDAVMPATGDENGLSLIDMRGLPYDDKSWGLLLDQLTVKDMAKLILNGMYATVDLRSVGKPATVDFDGPAGISSYMTSLSSTAYPSEVVIASTFNTELVYRMGVMVGNEGIANKVTGWYAPAMNIHRSPFGGRNFEYYSEDPLLSGRMGAACVSGASSKGMYCTIKHFAVNDQETNRINNGVAVWVNEQAMREIYLKPFEYTVKNAVQTIRVITDDQGTVSEVDMPGYTAVMSSFNRIGATWAGGSVPLMDNVLRGEWGFRGLAITDFDLYDYMYPDQSIAAGTDLILSTDAMKSLEDTKSATAVSNMREACHNILYTVAHSNAMNGVAPGTIITYTDAPWVTYRLVIDAAVGVLWAAALAWIVVRVRKNRAQ